MYQKTAIDMRLAKISAKIYELEDRCFKMTEETNKLLNEVSELVAVRYREAKASEKKSHNLYSDDFADLTQAITIPLKKGRPVKGSIS